MLSTQYIYAGVSESAFNELSGSATVFISSALIFAYVLYLGVQKYLEHRVQEPMQMRERTMLTELRQMLLSA